MMNELFQDKKAEKIMYDYLTNLGMNLDDKVWENFLEKQPSIDDMHYLDSINHYLKQAHQFEVTGNEFSMMKDMTEKNLTSIADDFSNGRLMYVDTDGKFHSGAAIVGDYNQIEALRPDMGIIIEDAIHKLTSEGNNFNISDYKKFRELALNPDISDIEVEDLVDSIGTSAFPSQYADLYKKSKEIDVQRNEELCGNILDKLDEIRLNQERIGFEYDANRMLEELSPDEKAAFEDYVQSVITGVVEVETPALDDAEKLDKAYDYIFEKQSERLKEDIKELNAENHYVETFTKCVADVDERKKLTDEIFKRDAEDLRPAQVTAQQNIVKQWLAEFEWKAANVCEEGVKNGPHAIEAGLGVVQGLHKSLIEKTKQFVFLKIDEKQKELASVKESIEAKKGLGVRAERWQERKLESRIGMYNKIYNHIRKSEKNVNRKIDELAMKQNQRNARINTMDYLSTDEFQKSFSENELVLLEDFSMIAKKSFTLEEANQLCCAFAASNGRFNPAALAKLDFESSDLTNMAMEAIRRADEITNGKLTLHEIVSHKGINMDLNNTILNNFNPDTQKIFMKLDPVRQEYLMEKFKEGVSKDIIAGEAANLVNDKDYSLWDASKGIEDKVNERLNNDIVPDELVKNAVNLNAQKALDNVAQTAKALNSTIRVTFTDEKTNTLYQLTAAKSGKQFVLKETNLETGETVIHKKTADIQQQIAKEQAFSKEITRSTRDFVHEEALKGVEEELLRKEEMLENYKAANGKVFQYEGVTYNYEELSQIACSSDLFYNRDKTITYEGQEYTYPQAREIAYALNKNEDVSKIANPEYDADKMYIICEGMRQGIDLTPYANEFDWTRLNEIRYGLIYGIDVSEIAKPEYSAEQMKKMVEEQVDKQLEDAKKENKKTAEVKNDEVSV